MNYVDAEDFSGNLKEVFEKANVFIVRNLHKIQAERSVNAPGLMEIPNIVFEELLVNALVHRDYFISSPVRIFILDDRIEIVSPEHLPNNLTVDNIKIGSSNIRSQIVATFVAKGLIYYCGLVSGITRALHAWKYIDFIDDREKCTFTAIIHIKFIYEYKTSIDKIKDNIIYILKNESALTVKQLALKVDMAQRSVECVLAELRQSGRLRRIGRTKGPRWEVLG